ncbi:MAG: tryptophan/tyrosine permease [Gammaproteobacteria bacterium CG11_big_fil_rev_8_21_14_0_20_46_22]|nr:MAG: tryptophan/tyrosine permease [Gammaproteobacteria bacterium CG12_big_fil_rev_8_21_14_0_65_46_12]PIR11698.1 MAG: tryptophan/tyrosine permease [Gammaproteobacteria bacterium CG11_big_fil_rev_8_21_14_0_20_46_22]
MLLRLIGCTLMVAGTSIGAGLLALPTATAASGFLTTTLTLLVCWVFMTAGAFYILEVSLKLKQNTNLISMAKASLGLPGQIITLCVYLLLLYALLSAYIAGGSDVVHMLLAKVHLAKYKVLDTLIFTLIFAAIVIRGVRTVDWTNRLLMTVKLGTFFALLVIISPHITTHQLETGSPHAIWPAVMVVITSFGFAVIIPSLRSYLNDNVKHLRIAITAGSFIALACYWLWCLVVQGNLPLHGSNGLIQIAQSGSAVSGLTNALSQMLNRPSVTFAVHLFASISVLTSFLAVALSLSDFLADGLKLKKQGNDRVKVYAATFLPPLVIVLVYPGAFIQALAFAGILCVILLILLPALMAYRMREKHEGDVRFETPGGKTLLATTGLAAIVLLVIGFWTF